MRTADPNAFDASYGPLDPHQIRVRYSQEERRETLLTLINQRRLAEITALTPLLDDVDITAEAFHVAVRTGHVDIVRELVLRLQESGRLNEILFAGMFHNIL